MSSSNGLMFYSFTSSNSSIGSELFDYGNSYSNSNLPPPPPKNLYFSELKKRKSLSLLDFEEAIPSKNYTKPFVPVNHVTVQRPPATKKEYFRPPSIHQSFVHSKEYFPYSPYRKPPNAVSDGNHKKTVKWHSVNQVIFTHSPDEYDRTIDNETIQMNTNQKRNYMLMKINPTLRKEDVFRQLSSLDFDKF